MTQLTVGVTKIYLTPFDVTPRFLLYFPVFGSGSDVCTVTAPTEALIGDVAQTAVTRYISALIEENSYMFGATDEGLSFYKKVQQYSEYCNSDWISIDIDLSTFSPSELEIIKTDGVVKLNINK